MCTPPRTVFLNLYNGQRFIFRPATHASLFIEGDEFEWTYANSSDPASTHGVTYRGVVYERPRRFLYGDWQFWKTVAVGKVETGFGKGVVDKDGLAAIRLRVKALAGADAYVDAGYRVWGNNCWTFCYDTLEALGIQVEPGLIEAFNDEWHRIPKGTTKWIFSWLAWLIRKR